MIDKESLRKVVRLQREELKIFEQGVLREELEKIDINVFFAVILSGIRRCGKSTLLRQLMKKADGFYYFNFEDSRATEFSVEDFDKLDEIFHEEYGSHSCYFFDEIQNISKWELFVRRLVDIKKHVIITGPNASLLSKELGTRLTGRHLNHEIFPFSFVEFLKMNKEKAGVASFDKYLSDGGFPEYLTLKRPDVLQELLKDVIARDITARYNIRNQKALMDLAVYLLTNIGKKFTYNSLKNNLKFASINSVISFVSYFEDTYMLFTIPMFDYSVKKTLVNPKKVYAIDNGFVIRNSSSFFDDRGRLLENLVFLNLKRKYKEIFYFQGNAECDFLVKKDLKVVKAIQVCYDVNRDSREREINGLLEAMNKFNLKEGSIITFNQEDKFVMKDKIVKLIPAWKWLIK